MSNYYTKLVNKLPKLKRKFVLAKESPDDMIIPGYQPKGGYSLLTEHGSELHMRQMLTRRLVNDTGFKVLRTKRVKRKNSQLLMINLYEKFAFPIWCHRYDPKR